MNESKQPVLSCFGSMGTPHGFWGFNTCFSTMEGFGKGWPNGETRKIAQNMAACEFNEAIPWIDGPPGELYPLNNPDERSDISGEKEGYIERVRNFVNYAHELGMRVHLFFAVGPVAIARADENGKPIVHAHTPAVSHPDMFTATRDGHTSLELVMRGEITTGFAGLGYPEIRSELAAYYVGEGSFPISLRTVQ